MNKTDSDNDTTNNTEDKDIAPSQSELDDNELKAKKQREELERTNAEHKTDDFHTVEALKEQEAYERGQKELREDTAKE